MKRRKYRMEYSMEVIGIDHGWSNMKTVRSIFTSGVKIITTEPAFFDNVLELHGTYYKVGGSRMEVKDTKVTDDNYYILTLAAIAKELEQRGIRNANLLLAVGLPLTRFGAERQDFIEYLSKNKEISFKFENKTYCITIRHVSVFPQCYAAIVDRIHNLPEKVVVVDVGSWTIDIMPVLEHSPDESECITSPNGLIKCMRAINEQCVRQLGNEISESDIQEVMKKRISTLPKRYLAIVEEEIRKFVEKVYYTLKENGYNLDITPIIFVGGGATVMRMFGDRKDGNFKYIEDIKANAKGYEYLGKLYLVSNKRKLDGSVKNGKR